MKLMKIAIQVVLAVVIVILAYLVWESIQQPIRFREAQSIRNTKVVERLKAIRTAEVAYEKQYGCYTSNYDSLLNFIKTGKMSIIKKEGTPPDTLTEQKALELGLIKRDTIWIGIYEGLFEKDYPELNIDSLSYVPFVEGHTIGLAIDSIVSETGTVYPVFEAKISLDIYLKGLDKQEIINLKAEKKRLDRYPGLKVGSLKEVSKSGNWERE